ncbi:MAG TPA: AAA family ATPase [Candidatus Angelobacter sp.]|nr:AAA family ATPase [Candidatus Angelobacter sp.]
MSSLQEKEKEFGSNDPAPEASAFRSSMEHILAELERIDLLIEAQVWHARQLNKSDDLQGLYISEQEVDVLLAQPIGLPRWATIPLAGAATDVRAAIAHLAASLEVRKQRSFNAGVPLRLETLASRFHLSPVEADTVLLCLAAELDLRYEKLYAYLQDDVTRKRPSVDLVLNLLSTAFSDKLEGRRYFHPSAPLLKHQLISFADDTTNAKTPLLNRFLKLDERIVDYLLGEDALDSRLAGFVSLLKPSMRSEDMILPTGLIDRLKPLVEEHRNPGRSLNLYFHGPYGVGKRSTAGVLCAHLGWKLLVVDSTRIVSSGPEFAALVNLIMREATLQQAAVYWQNFGVHVVEDQRDVMALLLHELQAYQNVTFFGGEALWEPSDFPLLPPFIRISFPRPSYSERLLLWDRALAGKASSGIDTAKLANKFRFSGGQIRDAAATAQNLAQRRGPIDTAVEMSDLLEACRLQSNRKLAALATQIVSHHRWSDIVLPPDRMSQLREICNAMEYRSLVYDQWGFDGKLSLGKGLSLLFTGPSGTGKTMGAEILAGELGLDLYKIDLSTVVSKYIGETEKNLARIFTEAATSNAILFFDEADALFGKRSEVRDSHDRYANVEINYLLQRMEEYEGTVILATNLRKNMDEAFVRRIQFTIEFPFPNAEQRLAIWQRIFPRQMPRADLDLEFMARRFEIAGGSIRNIALSAAFLGATDGGCVTMQHLIHATRQEFQKMGKVVMEGEFAREKKPASIPSGREE